MRELNGVEIPNVSGALIQSEPGSTTSEVHRNPRYVYWDATDSSLDMTSTVVERL